MREFAGSLLGKFIISFRHLGSKFSSQNFPDKQGIEYPQNSMPAGDVNTVLIGETSNSPAKLTSILKNVPNTAENVTSRIEKEGCKLMLAERNCVMTSSEEEVEGLIAVVSKKITFFV